jgi:hypothetical protein
MTNYVCDAWGRGGTCDAASAAAGACCPTYVGTQPQPQKHEVQLILDPMGVLPGPADKVATALALLLHLRDHIMAEQQHGSH